MSDHKPVWVRCSYSDMFKRQVVAETCEPGVSIALVARRDGINANVVFGWLRDRNRPASLTLSVGLPLVCFGWIGADRARLFFRGRDPTMSSHILTRRRRSVGMR